MAIIIILLAATTVFSLLYGYAGKMRADAQTEIAEKQTEIAAQSKIMAEHQRLMALTALLDAERCREMASAIIGQLEKQK